MATTSSRPAVAEALASAPQPTAMAVLRFAAAAYLCFVLVLGTFRSYPEMVRHSRDNESYIEIASGLRHWDRSQMNARHFWGLPYVIAGLELATGLPGAAALALICLVSSGVTLWLATKLWGGWIAAWLAVINWDWIMRSVVGGAEPLFMALLCASFLAERKQRSAVAVVAAALATTVRPVGILALAALALVWMGQRNYRKVIVAAAITICVAVAYLVPMAMVFGNAWANVASYQTDWQGRSPVFVPFVQMVRSVHPPATNILKIGAWVAFTLVAVVMMFCSRAYRKFAHEHYAEAAFATLYLLFLFSYNSPWAWAEFPRLVIPALPMILLAVEQWIPRNWKMVWVLGTVSAVLAAVSAVGLPNVIRAIRS